MGLCIYPPVCAKGCGNDRKKINVFENDVSSLIVPPKLLYSKMFGNSKDVKSKMIHQKILDSLMCISPRLTKGGGCWLPPPDSFFFS